MRMACCIACPDFFGGSVIHGFARSLSLEKVLFGPVNLVVCLEQREHGSRQDGKPVPASLPGHYLELHVSSADMFHLQEPEFAEPDSCAIEQSDDCPVLEIGSRSEDLSDLFLCQDIGKTEFLSGIEGMWHNIRRGQYVFKKEAATLGRHPAFIPADSVFFLDVVDVGGDPDIRDKLCSCVSCSGLRWL